MNCSEFELAWVSDDESERSDAEAHAATCPRCAEIVREDRELLEQAAGWKNAATALPAGLERRIADRLAVERPTTRRRPVWLWAAAAAIVITGIMLVGRSFLPTHDASPHEVAIAEVEAAKESYARAIAQLERQAEDVLARSADPAVSSRDAALLLNYRDRLTHLDSVIAEVQAFLDENPGHKNGHTVLLAAYREKDELLREILEFSPGETS
jgi:hypothetical protein